MDTIGWVAVTVAMIGGARLVIGNALDQVRPLAAKFTDAVLAIREAREVIDPPKRPSEDDE
nr:hypothetical protein OG513_07890 [Streptomyces sp. NBC_00998]